MTGVPARRDDQAAESSARHRPLADASGNGQPVCLLAAVFL